MEDLTALAVRLSQSVGDARGVLILSRDGLVLGAHPPDAEERLKVPWLRFASLGECERGFVQFGGEIWSYVRRGAYAGFVLSGVGVRPGFVLDQIEIALLHAEEARLRREQLRGETPPPVAAPSGKPRTPLHPEARPEPPVVIRAEAPSAPARAGEAAPPAPAAVGPAPAPAAVGPALAPAARSEPAPPPASAGPPSAEQRPKIAAAAEASAGPSPPDRAGPAGAASDLWGEAPEGSEEQATEEEEIDRFSLAREFSQLLQEREEGADG